MYALQIADASLRKAGLLPDPPRPEDDLADIPVVKAFVVRDPSASAQSIQDFYAAYDRNKMFFDAWQARATEAGGLSMFLRLDSMHKTLGSQAQFVRDIWKNPTMPPEEKRQFIDDAYRGMLAGRTTCTNLTP